LADLRKLKISAVFPPSLTGEGGGDVANYTVDDSPDDGGSDVFDDISYKVTILLL